jgi:hypothetical protein
VKKSSILLICVLLLITYSCCKRNAVTEIIYIDNGKISLGFNKKTGAFISFRDLINSQDLLDNKIPQISLWKIEISTSSVIETLDMNCASKFSCSKPDPLTLILKWKAFADLRNKNVQVTATVSLDNNKSMSSWKISIEGIMGKQINQVAFPIISGIADLGEEYFAVPSWMGQVIKDPRTALSQSTGQEKKFEWSYPGQLSLQCLTLYDPQKCGLYAACNDSLGFRKSFSLSLDSLNSLVFKMLNYPSLDSTLTSYSPSYSSIIGSYKGDWITAAGIYREWGSKQRWSKESRFRSNLTPAWLDSTALWVWNRGKSPNVLKPAEDMKQRLGLPVNVFWHWWHGCSYDDGFPEYIPPREGKESFVSAISASQDKGIRSIVYMNQALWGITTESWKNENAAPASAKNPEGNTITQVFNIFTNKPTAYMCIGTAFWKDKYSSLCDSAVNTYKANGVYMDMACLSLLCYDRSHGHPVGGGNYWIEHFGNLTRQIRSKIPSQNQIVLAGEGCGEVWLPYLDLFLTLDVSKERYAGIGPWETIPFFQAVYHQYGITYGNYSSLIVPPYDKLWPKEYAPKEPLKLLDKGFNKQFLMEQARSFVWGLQPTIANYQSFLASDRMEEIKYLLNLAKTRNHGLQYLLYGKFLRSPDINSPEEGFNISRLSIYAGKKGNTVTTLHGTFPLIYSGTWQADNKQVGIALASISDNPFRVDFSLHSSDYELPPTGKINIIEADGKRFLTAYSNEKIHVDFILNPKSLCIIEIVPDK